MKFSLKIAAATVILVSLVFAAGAGILLDSSFRSALDREKEAAVTAYRSVAGALSLAEGNDRTGANPTVILRQFTSGGTKSWSGIWLREENGALLYHWGAGGKTSRAEEDLAAMQKAGCVLRVEAGERGKEQIRIVGRISSGKTAALGMTFDVSEVYRLRDGQEKTYLFAFLITVLLAAVFSYISARILTRPLAVLAGASRRISGGDLSARAPEGGDDELGMLSREFNRMAESVEKSVDTIREEGEKKERFMGYFAHEVKTPMTSVIGYADLIRSGSLEGEEARDAAAYIFSEGKRLENLSAKLLDILVAGNGTAEWKTASPGTLVREFVRRNARLMEAKAIRLEEECEEGEAKLDEALFFSMLTNLTENAARAMPGGGRILIRVNMTGEGFLLTVQDDGPGIPKEALAHLTEAFYRVDKARSRQNGGAGLGLTLCEKIAELHRGSLAFRSEEGKGTAVTARFSAGRVFPAEEDGKGGGDGGKENA